MCDRFNIRGPVPQLDKNALGVLQAVGGTRDSVAQTVGMIILKHLARALFEVGGRDDSQVGFQIQPVLGERTVGVLDHNLEQAIGLGFKERWKDDFALPTRSVLWNDLANGFVTPTVTTRGVDEWRE